MDLDSRYRALSHAAIAAAQAGDAAELNILIAERDEVISRLDALPAGAEATEARLLDAARAASGEVGSELRKLTKDRTGARRFTAGAR